MRIMISPRLTLFLVFCQVARGFTLDPWTVTYQTNGRFQLSARGDSLQLASLGPATGYVVRRVRGGEGDPASFQAVVISLNPSLKAGARGEVFVLGRNSRGKTLLYTQLGRFTDQPVSFRKLVCFDRELSYIELGMKIDEMDGEITVTESRLDNFSPETNGAAGLPREKTRWAVTGVDRTWNTPVFEPRRRDTALKLMAAAGVDSTRMGISWETVESEPGHPSQTNLLQALETYRSYGIGIPLVCLGGTPGWASGKDPGRDLTEEQRAKLGPYKTKRAYWAPTNWDLWEAYVSGLVRAASNRVKVWEVINEPDLSSEGFMGSYEDYRLYLMHAYRAAKKADPSCRVFTGAFVYDAWLPKLYRDQDTPWFDGICSHPYATTGLAAANRNRTLWAQSHFLGAAKEIWVTEVGFQSSWKQGPGFVENPEEKAKEGLVAIKEIAKTSGLVTWYCAHEEGQMFGLTHIASNQSLNPTPMYYKYGEATGRLMQTDPPFEIALEGTGRISAGESRTVILTARNKKTIATPVDLWPVGFLDELGPSHPGPRDLDQHLTLAPGATRSIQVKLKPREGAKGKFPVGLVVRSLDGNALALSNLEFSF